LAQNSGKLDEKSLLSLGFILSKNEEISIPSGNDLLTTGSVILRLLFLPVPGVKNKVFLGF